MAMGRHVVANVFSWKTSSMGSLASIRVEKRPLATNVQRVAKNLDH